MGKGTFWRFWKKDSAGRSVSGEQEESRAEQEKLMGILEEKNPKGLQRETKRKRETGSAEKSREKGKSVRECFGKCIVPQGQGTD